METDSVDKKVRLKMYSEFVETGRSPSSAGLAAMLNVSVEQIRASLERLAAGKVIVLQPESREILMAAPLCAVPTPFVVHAVGKSYFAPCAWDALGIIAMLRRDATLETSCPCCGEALALDVRDAKPSAADSIIHFGLPAKQWWENIVFT